MESPHQTIDVSKGLPSELIKTSDPSQALQEATETASRILAIIFEYALNKFDDSAQRFASGRPKFLQVIDRFVKADTRLEMCLPAFPFKSANKVYKVLGVLPDKAEELALERLNSMCVRIGDLYSPGARLTIISDGLVYNGRQLRVPSSIFSRIAG